MFCSFYYHNIKKEEMLMNKKEDFTPGTIVSLSEGSMGNPCFAVVFEENFWIECASQENPEIVKQYKEHIDLFVPVRVLGRRIGLKHDFNDSRIEPDDGYIQHYTHGQINAHMQIVSIDETVKWINIFRSFNGVNLEYFSEVKSDIEMLKMYLDNKYAFLSITADILFNLFQKGIPI